MLLDRPVRPQSDLAALAAGLLRDRQKRAEHLPADFFGEPAWDALLVLFAAPGNEMRQIDLFRAIRVPHTSGLRWQCRLKEEGLVATRPGVSGRSKLLVKLTAKGRNQVTRLLSEL
ncbi:MAG: hypothetical protein M3448_00375 [Pseudomonadota bacterium]|nr:hypothetical protein [Pseudomonadota bacterium]